MPSRSHPQQAATLVRLFELYSSGSQTFETLADALEREGHVYQASRPRFHRTALHWILNNRFYVGELHRNGQVFEGRYKLLIDRATFDACQDVMNGRNRRTGNPEHAYSGGLFTCAHCAHVITGERIRRRLKDGGVREHSYYRCANNEPVPDHPTVRWKAEDLEQAIVADLASMRMPSPEVAMWFRTTLREAVDDLTSCQHRQAASLAKRKSELLTMQDRLLNAYLAGTVEEIVYKAKQGELKAEIAKTNESVASLGDVTSERANTAIELFDWTQRAADVWVRSKIEVRREILDAVSLNRALGHLTLDVTKRKPFDILAKLPNCQISRGDGI